MYEPGWHEFAASALGALVGAWVAFRLEREQRASEKRAHNIEAGYRAVLALGLLRDHAKSLQATLVNPWRDSPQGWYFMQPVAAFPPFDVHVDVSALAFLMATGRPGDAQAVQDTLVSEHAFYAWRAALQARNDARIEAMQLLSRVHEPGKAYTDAELETVLGPKLKRYLQQSADALPIQGDRALQQLRDSASRLHEALGRAIPRHQFQFPNETDQPG